MYNNSMLLGFKTELDLNNQQRTALAKHAEVARHAWNWGLCKSKIAKLQYIHRHKVKGSAN